uniref:Uncharacterized protein n=1 Tax=Canis lupus dingo TaxID=286419 RepID=A0A8C0JRV9_CANLU
MLQPEAGCRRRLRLWAQRRPLGMAGALGLGHRGGARAAVGSSPATGTGEAESRAGPGRAGPGVGPARAGGGGGLSGASSLPSPPLAARGRPGRSSPGWVPAPFLAGPICIEETAQSGRCGGAGGERGACAALRCCPEAKPRARPTSCLGLSRRLPRASPRPRPRTPPRRPPRDQRAMSPGQRAGGDARKDGPAGGGGGRPATAAGAWAVSALCLLLSVGSAAACLLLGAQAAALQGRVATLEEERELLRRAGPPGALAAWAEPHLERLLREKLEGLAKHRTVREAPTACICPPVCVCKEA